MKLDNTDSFSNLSELPDMIRYVQILSGNLANVINNGLSFTDNFRAQIVGATFISANADTTILHKLNFVPTGYLSVGQNAAMSIYDGTNTFQRDRVILRASAVGAARLLVF